MKTNGGRPKPDDKYLHYESITLLEASAQEAFDYLDDPKRLSSHMNKSSWMMAGSKMNIQTDINNGRTIGSEIILKGKMMGIPLFVKERITARTPPYSKIWETVGPQKMIILHQYRMGFEIIPEGSKARLRVFIDYSIPNSGLSYLLGKISANFYAKWCTEMMVRDANDAFKEAN